MPGPEFVRMCVVLVRNYLKQIRAAESRLCNVGNAGLPLLSGRERGLEGIHVEVEFSVGTNSLTPLAGQCFHIADQELEFSYLRHCDCDPRHIVGC